MGYGNLFKYEEDCEYLSRPVEFKSLILEGNFGDYHVILTNFFGNNAIYDINENDNSINSIFIFGNCESCKLIKYNPIKDDEKIKIWDIYHDDSPNLNFFCSEFTNDYLKDKYLISKNRNCTSIDKKVNMGLDKSFEEIYPNNLFFYHETEYYERNEFSSNINELLSFFTSNIKHRVMTIIKSINEDKLEILFESKNTHKLNGHSIFPQFPKNFIDFLNSSYGEYIKLKESNFNIDLLILYYIFFKNEVYINIKHLFGSIFIETLIAQYNVIKTISFRKKTFAEKLEHILTFDLNLNIPKLFDKFEKDLLNELEEIVSLKMNNLHHKHNINIVLNDFKKYFFIEIIKTYRNKNVHHGEIEFNSSDLENIVNISLDNTNKSCNGEINEKIIGILCENKNIIINSRYIKDLNTQNRVIENLMEVILLKLLNTNCKLLYNKLRPHINSKEYIKSLSLKK